MPKGLDALTDERLQNWGDYVRSTWGRHGKGRQRCPGLEGQYRAPLDQTQEEADERSKPWRAKVDEKDGAFVDRVIAAQWFPVQEAAFLRAHYVLRSHERHIVRNLGILKGHYEAWLKRSVIMARNRLTVADASVYRRAHNSTAATCETEACGPSQASASPEAVSPEALPV